MNYTKILPSKDFANIIEFYWNFEGEFSDSARYSLSSTASVNPKLAFQYEKGMTMRKDNREEALFTSGFQCQTNSFYQMSTNKKAGIFGVSFQPYAIPLLFKTPASVLTNCNVEISDLLGNEGKILQDKIVSCADMRQRVNTIKSFVKSKLIQSDNEWDAFLYSVRTIKSHQGNINIDELSSLYNLSQRQFERKFKSLTGFTPKAFASIIRFEECINHACLYKQSLTELAFDSGYYDQSHMIRDFKKFTGKSPKDYFAEDHSIFLV